MEIDEIPVGKATNLKGQRFGKLVVLYRTNPPIEVTSPGVYWKCQCDCGNITAVRATSLKSGVTKSCGCYRVEKSHNNKGREAIDLTGQQFGKLTVLSRDGYDNNHKIMWRCQCNCGNITRVRGNDLRTNKIISCGCYKNELSRQRAAQVITPGERFGKLIALKRVEVKNNTGYWLCQCDCGNTLKVSTNNLTQGNTKSCGCTRGDNHTLLIPSGTRFGKLTVIELIDKKNRPTKNGTYYKCKCDCGGETIVHRMSLINGATQSCGCLRSRGEEKIQNLLQQHQLKYIKEKTFNDCCSDCNGKLRFDFYVENTYLIEYDGIQHYYPNFGATSFIYTQKHDQIKNKYCETHDIPLIRIPYWHYDKITIDDLRPETSQFLI